MDLCIKPIIFPKFCLKLKQSGAQTAKLRICCSRLEKCMRFIRPNALQNSFPSCDSYGGCIACHFRHKSSDKLRMETSVLIPLVFVTISLSTCPWGRAETSKPTSWKYHNDGSQQRKPRCLYPSSSPEYGRETPVHFPTYSTAPINKCRYPLTACTWSSQRLSAHKS